MPRKVTLQIKNEGLELLKKHSIRETTRIINTRYSLDLNPTTILRWKKQEDSILKNMAVTKAAKKTINCSALYSSYKTFAEDLRKKTFWNKKLQKILRATKRIVLPSI